MLKTYSEEKLIRTCDSDLNGQWRPGSILETMQEIAGTHAEYLGCGRNALFEKNIVWVLLRNEINMVRYPKITEKIRVITYPKENRRVFCPRFYRFEDENGNRIGEASSLWALIDINTRHMVAPDEFIKLLPKNEDIIPGIDVPSVIGSLEGESFVSDYKPVYTDLDVNGHVNNTKYCDWLCNALGVETMKIYQLRNICLNYKAEVIPENDVKLNLTRNEYNVNLTGTVDDKVMFRVSGILEKRAE